LSVEWRESFAYTDDDLALAVRWGWIKRRWFGRGYKQTTKGRVHTREKIRQHDEFRALITPLVELEDAGHLSPEEKRESQIAICVCACRLNEEQYHQSRQALIDDYGFDPEMLP
jgi:hypothetical protein